MKRSLLLTVLLILATTVAFAGPAKEAPEEITLDSCGVKKAAVAFAHKAHLERARAVEAPGETMVEL